MNKTQEFIDKHLQIVWRGEWVNNIEAIKDLHELLKAQRELCAETFCNQDEDVFNVDTIIKNTPEP